MHEGKPGAMTLTGNLPLWENKIAILMPKEFNHIKGKAFYSIWVTCGLHLLKKKLRLVV